jgi:hypothetical protein
MSEGIRSARTVTENGDVLTPFENSKAQAHLLTNYSKTFFTLIAARHAAP